MRSFLTYGLISLVGVASLYACGDDSGDGPGPGVGGSAGQGGSGGQGGSTAGTAGMAGSGGGGAAGSSGGGAGGAPSIPAANCTGCVQLTVQIPATPVSPTAGSQGGYIFSAPATAAPFDLSNVTSIVWKVQALTTGANFFVQPFLQTAPPEDPNYAYGAYPATVPLAPATFAANTWVDVAIDVASLAGPAGAGDAGADAAPPSEPADAGDAGSGPVLLTAFDKSKVRTIGLNVGANAAAGAGVVSVEVDSVTVVGTSNFTTKEFTADVEGLQLNMYMVPPGTQGPAFR